ncbi:MAG TPA: hypothetical protein VKN99_02410 [Polyangia bacterium]|nr:hypothetical protein [Polyangia bacterium]
MALVAAALMLGAGCGTPAPRAVDLSGGDRSYTAEDYGRVVNRWTRHGSLQKDFDRVAPFDTALDVRATFEAWDWRWAYVERYAEYYKLPDGEKDKLRSQQLQEAEQFHEFHVAATASRYEWTDFVNKKNAVWRVVLFDDRQREVEPVELYPIKVPVVQEVAFFPYVGGIDQAFLSLVRFRFPTKFEDGTPTVSPEARHVTLRFSGPLGTVDLVWDTVLAKKK